MGAVCGKVARTALCGGRPVMGVPTAIKGNPSPPGSRENVLQAAMAVATTEPRGGGGVSQNFSVSRMRSSDLTIVRPRPFKVIKVPSVLVFDCRHRYFLISLIALKRMEVI